MHIRKLSRGNLYEDSPCPLIEGDCRVGCILGVIDILDNLVELWALLGAAWWTRHSIVKGLRPAGGVKRRTGVRSTLSVPTGSPQAPRSGVFLADEAQWASLEYLRPQPTPPDWAVSEYLRSIIGYAEK